MIDGREIARLDNGRRVLNAKFVWNLKSKQDLSEEFDDFSY